MPLPLSLRILSNFGLIGSGYSSSILPKSATPESAARQYKDFVDSGGVSNPDIWGKYSSLSRRPVSFDAMLAMWDEMANWDLMAAALSELVQETIQTDAFSKGTLWYETNQEETTSALNSMLQRVGMEDVIASQVWHVAALGNSFDKLEYSRTDGVTGLSFVHPFDVRRYWLEKNRKCIGFRWKGHHPNKEDIFTTKNGDEAIQRVALGHGNSTEDLHYPWDFMHMRRMFRLRSTEHGEPIFEEAQGIYKKLRLAIDQMVVHRAQVQPDRYAINIDTKDQPPVEQYNTVQRWKQSLRSKISFGSRNGADSNSMGEPTSFDSFYNALSLDTILWISKPTGYEHSVTKLAGTASVPDVYDIELLTDLFYSIIGMPKSWFGITKDQQPASGKSLLAQDIRFLRKIKGIRRAIVNSYTWLGYFDCVLRGIDITKLEINAKMSQIGSLEDQMRIEVVEAQAAVLNSLGDVMDKYNLPRDAWVELIFKKYLHLPDEVVGLFLTALPPEAEPVAEGRKPTPATSSLLREISDISKKSLALNSSTARLEAARNGQEFKQPRMYRTVEDVVSPPAVAPGDIIAATNSDNLFEYVKKPIASGKVYSTKIRIDESSKNRAHERLVLTKKGEKSSESKAEPAYRRWLKIKQS